MNKAIGCGVVSALLFCCGASTAASASGQSTLARDLLEGCLRTPTSDAVSQLAAKVGALSLTNETIAPVVQRLARSR